MLESRGESVVLESMGWTCSSLSPLLIPANDAVSPELSLLGLVLFDDGMESDEDD